MKLLLLLVSIAFADPFSDNVYRENQAVWRLAAKKCGYSARNMNKFRAKVARDKDSVKQSCIDSKIAESKLEHQQSVDKINNRDASYRAARQRLKCSDFSGRFRDLCIVSKGR